MSILFVRGANVPWTENAKAIVTDAVKSLRRTSFMKNMTKTTDSPHRYIKQDAVRGVSHSVCVILDTKMCKGGKKMIGSRIALLRKCQGMSQAQLAHTLHISPSAIGMYEQGRREPDLNTLVAMAQLFHTSMDYLCTGKLQLVNDGDTLQLILHKLCNDFIFVSAGHRDM